MKIPFASLSSWKLSADKIVRYRRKRKWIGWHRHSGFALSRVPGTTKASSIQPFVGDDLDAEAGQSLVIVHRGREMDDRGDAEIAQDLGADADFAPLPVAIGFRGFLLGARPRRNSSRAIAQIDQHAAAGLVEVVQHDLH